MIDLRSDTVTRPTPAMREAMARAVVGDDVYGEDPTVKELEERTAALLGKEAALFVSSGTMGNQLALLTGTRRADEVIVGEDAHMAFYESGAAPMLAGVQFAVAGTGGLFGADDVVRATKPSAYYHPRSSLVAVENTHNRGGGRVFPQRDVLEIAAVARRHGLGLHLDGARLWNASVATRLPPRELATPFDSVSVCFSKGLGAPVGSCFASDRDRVIAARRFRKILGGGMRQVGLLAAAALHALDHHVDRLAEDHARARRLAEALVGAPGVRLDPARVETNIVVFETALPAEGLVERVRREGVLLSVMGTHLVRVVTHLDVDDAAVSTAIDVVRRVLRDGG